MEFFFIGAVLVAAFALMMIWIGYRLGIQHTEARWSDAVAKSSEARRRVIAAYAAANYADLRAAVENLKTFG